VKGINKVEDMDEVEDRDEVEDKGDVVHGEENNRQRDKDKGQK
jgi:hypothetical protein